LIKQSCDEKIVQQAGELLSILCGDATAGWSSRCYTIDSSLPVLKIREGQYLEQGYGYKTWPSSLGLLYLVLL
jgi:hypothetical protein